MSLWHVVHLNTYLDLVTYLQDTKIWFNCKANLTSAIGNISKLQHLASYVSCPNPMAYDTAQSTKKRSMEISISSDVFRLSSTKHLSRNAVLHPGDGVVMMWWLCHLISR
jgi:hypothetical protein